MVLALAAFFSFIRCDLSTMKLKPYTAVTTDLKPSPLGSAILLRLYGLYLL